MKQRLNISLCAGILVYLVVEGFTPSTVKFDSWYGWLALPAGMLALIIVFVLMGRGKHA